MKFAREYQERLLHDDFPPHWISSAISYGQLKKCIKRVQRELASLGLDVFTLQRLLQSVETQNQAFVHTTPNDHTGASAAPNELANDAAEPVSVPNPAPSTSQETGPHAERPFQYLFHGTAVDSGHIKPQLLFVVDAETGEPLDARLAPETREYLHQLAVAERLTNVRIADVGEPLTRRTTGSTEGEQGRRDSYSERTTTLVSVPLTSDSEFFGVLEKELVGLAELQRDEQKKLSKEIVAVGRRLGRATNPEDSKARADLAHWRKLFELYLESNIFFATYEQDHGMHDAAKAQKQYEFFMEQAEKAGLLGKFKKEDSAKALETFLDINDTLLKNLKFQEINHIALTKILKKFDKRTALSAKGAFPSLVPPSVITPDFSRALASEVSTNIISVIPQLDDYLCPICFQLAYRPIRLRCSHLFCIRCLIVMQREGKNKCPLCREECLLDADSTNLDKALQNFLKRYFRDEAKKKQKENEKAIYQDSYPDYHSEYVCTMM